MRAYKARKIAVRQNVWDNWNGYISGRKAATFLNCPQATAQEKAVAWKVEMERLETERAAAK